jgi:ferritin
MLSEKIETLLNKQIEMEFESSQYYLSMASWAEKSGFNGMSSFLYRHSDEERQHMLKLFHFVNDRGGHALAPEVGEVPKKFSGVKEVFQKILAHERKVSQKINELVGACLAENDHPTYNFLQWFVSEQMEEERTAQTLLDRLELIGTDKGGLYLFDRDLEAFVPDDGGQD